jgi:hypothetical protein
MSIIMKVSYMKSNNIIYDNWTILVAASVVAVWSVCHYLAYGGRRLLKSGNYFFEIREASLSIFGKLSSVTFK